MSGGRGPAIPSPSGDREEGGAEVITNLEEVKEEVQSLRRGILTLTQAVTTLNENVAALSRPVNTLAGGEEGKRRRRERKE